MNRFLIRVALFTVTFGYLLLPVASAQSYLQGMQSKPSTVSKLTSSMKSGFDKMAKTLVPKPSTMEAQDPISLSVPAKPSADLYLAVAHLAEQNHDLAKAELNYREALKMEPRRVDAIMAYAHMLDRQGKLTRAEELYRMAVQTQPNNATAHNDLGICFARQGKLKEAVAALGKAVQLQPKQARHRNNLATVLVQLNQVDEAFAQLNAVHPAAVAYYNMGYLVQKTGNMTGAARLIEEAIRLNPSLTEARVWLEKIRPEAMSDPSRPPQVVARRPSSNIPPSGSAAPMPHAGSPGPVSAPGATPPSQETIPPILTPSQTPPGQLAPLPSIRPLPPIQGGY